MQPIISKKFWCQPIHQYINGNSVVDWFKTIDNKIDCAFLKFDKFKFCLWSWKSYEKDIWLAKKYHYLSNEKAWRVTLGEIFYYSMTFNFEKEKLFCRRKLLRRKWKSNGTASCYSRVETFKLQIQYYKQKCINII